MKFLNTYRINRLLDYVCKLDADISSGTLEKQKFDYRP